MGKVQLEARARRLLTTCTMINPLLASLLLFSAPEISTETAPPTFSLAIGPVVSSAFAGGGSSGYGGGVIIQARYMFLDDLAFNANLSFVGHKMTECYADAPCSAHLARQEYTAMVGLTAALSQMIYLEADLGFAHMPYSFDDYRSSARGLAASAAVGVRVPVTRDLGLRCQPQIGLVHAESSTVFLGGLGLLIDWYL